MKIYEVLTQRTQLQDVLLGIWERSVRATHLFLADADVKKIKEYVPQALESVEHSLIAEAEKPIAFMGTQNGRLEMLFITRKQEVKGIGRQLLQYGMENYGILEVTVNEQNPQAVGFYEHMGFAVYKRSDWDEEGNPFPLLYMKRM